MDALWMVPHMHAILAEFVITICEVRYLDFKVGVECKGGGGKLLGACIGCILYMVVVRLGICILLDSMCRGKSSDGMVLSIVFEFDFSSVYEGEASHCRVCKESVCQCLYCFNMSITSEVIYVFVQHNSRCRQLSFGFIRHTLHSGEMSCHNMHLFASSLCWL